MPTLPVPREKHVSAPEFARQNHLRTEGATPWHSCLNCCYSAYCLSVGGLHCQHPLVRPRRETDVTGRTILLDTPLMLTTDNRDTVCDQFAEMVAKPAMDAGRLALLTPALSAALAAKVS